MPSDDHITEHRATVNPYTATDILAILRERHWLSADPTPGQLAWCERAAALLGHHVNDAAGLSDLLQLVFAYDAPQILKSPDSHAVLTRYAARDVIRQLAVLLDPEPFDSDRFKDVVTHLKETLEVRGRDLFHPLRLALAGRAGEGELDRVILLLDDASVLPFAVPVKSVRARILEFCSALV
jgi:nondiscriminating glutamyl-tRNA synthetase